MITRIGLVCAAVALAFGTGYLTGHNKGYDKAAAKYGAALTICVEANTRNLDTIHKLQDANTRFADAAKAKQAEADNAIVALDTQRKADADRLKTQQATLAHALAQDHDWSATRVPADVVSVLRDGASPH